MDRRKYLEDYTYIGITGLTYTPYIEDGRCYLVPGQIVSFWHFVRLCNVPDDEAMLIKLKYNTK